MPPKLQSRFTRSRSAQHRPGQQHGKALRAQSSSTELPNRPAREHCTRIRTRKKDFIPYPQTYPPRQTKPLPKLKSEAEPTVDVLTAVQNTLIEVLQQEFAEEEKEQEKKPDQTNSSKSSTSRGRSSKKKDILLSLGEQKELESPQLLSPRQKINRWLQHQQMLDESEDEEVNNKAAGDKKSKKKPVTFGKFLTKYENGEFEASDKPPRVDNPNNKGAMNLDKKTAICFVGRRPGSGSVTPGDGDKVSERKRIGDHTNGQKPQQDPKQIGHETNTEPKRIGHETNAGPKRIGHETNTEVLRQRLAEVRRLTGTVSAENFKAPDARNLTTKASLDSYRAAAAKRNGGEINNVRNYKTTKVRRHGADTSLNSYRALYSKQLGVKKASTESELTSQISRSARSSEGKKGIMKVRQTQSKKGGDGSLKKTARIKSKSAKRVSIGPTYHYPDAPRPFPRTSKSFDSPTSSTKSSTSDLDDKNGGHDEDKGEEDENFEGESLASDIDSACQLQKKLEVLGKLPAEGGNNNTDADVEAPSSMEYIGLVSDLAKRIKSACRVRQKPNSVRGKAAIKKSRVLFKAGKEARGGGRSDAIVTKDRKSPLLGGVRAKRSKSLEQNLSNFSSVRDVERKKQGAGIPEVERNDPRNGGKFHPQKIRVAIDSTRRCLTENDLMEMPPQGRGSEIDDQDAGFVESPGIHPEWLGSKPHRVATYLGEIALRNVAKRGARYHAGQLNPAIESPRPMSPEAEKDDTDNNTESIFSDEFKTNEDDKFDTEDRELPWAGGGVFGMARERSPRPNNPPTVSRLPTAKSPASPSSLSPAPPSTPSLPPKVPPPKARQSQRPPPSKPPPPPRPPPPKTPLPKAPPLKTSPIKAPPLKAPQLQRACSPPPLTLPIAILSPSQHSTSNISSLSVQTPPTKHECGDPTVFQSLTSVTGNTPDDGSPISDVDTNRNSTEARLNALPSGSSDGNTTLHASQRTAQDERQAQAGSEAGFLSKPQDSDSSASVTCVTLSLPSAKTEEQGKHIVSSRSSSENMRVFYNPNPPKFGDFLPNVNPSPRDLGKQRAPAEAWCEHRNKSRQTKYDGLDIVPGLIISGIELHSRKDKRNGATQTPWRQNVFLDVDQNPVNLRNKASLPARPIRSHIRNRKNPSAPWPTPRDPSAPRPTPRDPSAPRPTPHDILQNQQVTMCPCCLRPCDKEYYEKDSQEDFPCQFNTSRCHADSRVEAEETKAHGMTRGNQHSQNFPVWNYGKYPSPAYPAEPNPSNLSVGDERMYLHQPGQRMSQFDYGSAPEIGQSLHHVRTTGNDAQCFHGNGNSHIYEDSYQTHTQDHHVNDILGFYERAAPLFHDNEPSRFYGNDAPRFHGNDIPQYDQKDVPRFYGKDTPRFDGKDTRRFPEKASPRFEGYNTVRTHLNDAPRLPDLRHDYNLARNSYDRYWCPDQSRLISRHAEPRGPRQATNKLSNRKPIIHHHSRPLLPGRRPTNGPPPAFQTKSTTDFLGMDGSRNTQTTASHSGTASLHELSRNTQTTASHSGTASLHELPSVKERKPLGYSYDLYQQVRRALSAPFDSALAQNRPPPFSGFINRKMFI